VEESYNETNNVVNSQTYWCNHRLHQHLTDVPSGPKPLMKYQ